MNRFAPYARTTPDRGSRSPRPGRGQARPTPADATASALPLREFRRSGAAALPIPADGFPPVRSALIQARQMPAGVTAAAPRARETGGRRAAAALRLAALVLALALAGAATPARAADPAACFSIQVGTFANPDNALCHHARLLAALPPEAADQLRLERIGSLHVLRIGRAAAREDLAPLLAAVRATVDNPRIMAVDFLPQRFVIPPRHADLAEGAQPASPRPAGPTPSAAAPASGYSVQVGSYAEPDVAEKTYARLMRTLPPAAAAQLRLEANGSLYVLRLGLAPAPEDLAQLLDAVRTAGEDPQAVRAKLRPERFLIPPRDAGPAGSPQPPPPSPAAPTLAGRAAPAPPAAAPVTPAPAPAKEETPPSFAPAPARADTPAPAPQAEAAAGPAGPSATQVPETAPVAAGRTETASPAPSATARETTDTARPEPAQARPSAPAQPAPASAPVPAPLATAGKASPAGPLPEAIATGYTVQLGSYASRTNALAMHARLLAALPPDLAEALRVERVGIYYVLRLGLAPTRAEMLPALERMRAYSPLPVVLAAALDPDRLLVPPRGLGGEAAATAPGPAPAPARVAGPTPAGTLSVGQAPEAAPAGVATLPAALETPPAQAPEADEPLPPLAPFGATPREQDLIAARIATRTGQFPAGQKLYEKLLAEHPGDEEILEQYVDALVNAMEYDLANQLLADWMRRDPDNPRPLRLRGLMYVRAGENQRAYAPFEDLLERDPGDIGVMADLGFAKLGGGDWRRALELFSAVADEQPQNEAATQAVQEILIAHRPRLTSEYSTEFRADDAVLSTWASGFSSPLSDRWALDLKYDLTHLDRPSKDTQERIGHTIQDWMLTTRTLLHEDLAAFLGLGAVDGIGDRLAQQAGLEWQVHRPGRILVLAERNRPWLDRVDATRYEGFQDHASLAYSALYDDRWGLYLAAERFRYTILGEEFGRRNLGTLRLTRRLGWKPNLFAGYAYGFGSSEYKDNGPRVLAADDLVLPVTLDKEEESHSWFLTMDERACRNIRLLLSGGAGQNTISGNAFFFGSGEVLVEVGNRLTVRAGAGYNSDKSSVGGETTTFTVGILWIF